MITHKKIKQERLQAYITNIDDDGEKLRSYRRPKIVVFGTTVDQNMSIPDTLEEHSFETLITFELYRPAFVFVSHNLMKLSTPHIDTSVHGLIHTSGRAYFARVYNAKFIPEPIMQLTVGDENSTAELKISGITSDLLVFETNRYTYINSHYMFEP
jgi:hypothetical protein